MKERRGRRKDKKESKKMIAHNTKKRGTKKREMEIRPEEEKRCSVSSCNSLESCSRKKRRKTAESQRITRRVQLPKTAVQVPVEEEKRNGQRHKERERERERKKEREKERRRRRRRDAGQ